MRMIRCKPFFSRLAAVFAVLSVAGCSACGNIPGPQGVETASRADGIIIERYLSSAPEDFNRATLDCVRQKFTLPGDVVHKRGEYGSVADYLARFYAYTDAFHRARRYDSFILAYNPETGDRRRDLRCHVAMFTYDSNAPVQNIRRLENRVTTSLRKRPEGGHPGSLTFKAGTEYYRVFFSDKRVIFFFVYSSFSIAEAQDDDPGLYAAALELKECLLNEQ
jgi:hypothetical protein